MSIYARYFDQERLVNTADELIDFLASISEIVVTPQLEQDVRSYVESDIPYPKRYKVRPRVYFILIKSNATTMAEFRANHRKQNALQEGLQSENNKDERQQQLSIEQPGWYKCRLAFKRVIQIPETLKFQYQDSDFEAYIKAGSPLECYNRVLDYLQTRQDIDTRSQYPSARNNSFSFEYIGTSLGADNVQSLPPEYLSQLIS